MHKLRKRLGEYEVSPIREFGEFKAIDAGFDACDVVEGVLTIVSGEKYFLITQLRQPDWACYGTKQEQLICNGFPMARNKVQFQKGMSEAQFEAAYGTEELCHAALVN